MSARHESPQPNVSGRGIIAGYSPQFWAIVVGIGLAAGVAGAALIALLKLIQQAAYSYGSGTYLHGIERTSDEHRVLVLVLAGVIAAAGGYVVQQVGGSGATEISRALWTSDAKLPFWRSITGGVLSIVIVAMGASLGREAASCCSGR
ncbi:MAG: hypothetical protein ACR2OB_08375 [Solirubrobacteraceae bacterium]